MSHTVLRSTSNAIVVSTLLAVSSASYASAATTDCETMSAASVATVLGVPKARANPSSGHSKQPPDNMDVIGCSFVEVSPDPLAKTMVYFVYTPIPKDLASVFSSLSTPNIPGKPQSFSPGIGTGSTGWVRASANGETYDGSIVFHGATSIIVVKVGGMPNADAAKAALVKAGNILAKS
ncbi:MAG TPA: hypothetical protein VGQ44_05210 [Gemmatimonadaceae bacterium]|nr:hypothetical protein [Gemmatimonadaceae bacterium]